MSYDFQCKFCKKGFVREKAYEKHKCKQMIRHEEFHTAIGQTAFAYYNEWMKLNNRRILSPQSFISSRHFSAFIRFAELVRRAKTPRPQTFIWYMVHKQYQPSMWTMGEVYGEYLEFLDHSFDPYERVMDTINTFDAIKKDYGCKRTDIFDHISTSELIHHLTRKDMSPWLLLHCNGFKKYLANCRSSDLELINALIRLDHWKKKFTQKPEITEQIQELAKRLKL